ncbi:MAG: bifunctional metallophosphatase/5'-nucleotidase [Bacteroidales bacterium]|nr:bifunctional metallophosphatase/5'-nucleotidase [Bacteroidales bacterium]
MKRLLFVILVAAAAVACTPKAAPSGTAAGASSDIVILYDNDVHCSVDGYANMAALKAEMKAKTPYVTVVSNGDYVQGGSLGAASQGGYIIEIMNAVGYDLVTLGNHEFDYAIPRMKELTGSLTAKTICCNLLDLKADKRLFDPWVMMDYGGTKVAFIGVATPYSFNSSTPAFFQDEKGNYIYSLSAETFYDTVQNFIDDARAQGADYVVAMTHLGDDVNYDPINAHTLAAKTSGLDVILDGHSHSLVPSLTLTNKDGKPVIYSQTGAHFENLGVLTITPKGQVSTRMIAIGDYPKKDPAVEAVIDRLKKEYAALGARKIGHCEVTLPAKDAQGDWLVRNKETSLGDFTADAMRFALGTEIAFVGGGSIRKDLPAGEVRYDDIFNVFPFSNKGCIAHLTGQMILDVLEYSVSAYPTDFGGFLHPSGLTFEFDPSVESPVVFDINKAFVRIDAGERRVRNVRVLNPATGNFEKLDPTRTYSVGGTEYLLVSEGDGYTMLAKSGTNAGMTDVEILESYLVKGLGGNISTARYGESEGRVKCL